MKNVVTEEAMRAYYEEHLDYFQNVMHLAHIMLETEGEAKALLERIQAGESFGELAEEYSICPSNTPDGVREGDQGWCPWGIADEDCLEGASAIRDVGGVTGPVKSKYGYHIFKLLERAEQLSYEEAADLIRFAMERDAENEECE